MTNIKIAEGNKRRKNKTKEKVLKEDQELLDAFKTQEKELDKDLLASLKSKLNKQEERVPNIVNKQSVSINIGVIGIGQAGSRIAENFHKQGYDIGVINTSAQDLKFIDVLPSQKLLLEGSLGGTGKDLHLGAEIFENSISEVSEFVNVVADGNEMMFLCASGGGGCTTHDSMIVNSDGGIETIKAFYDRMKEGVIEFVRSDGQKYIDISNRNILSYSLDLDGNVFKNKIKQVWYNGKKKECASVKTKNGEYKVSLGHPFFVFEDGEIREKEAEKLEKGDLLINAGNQSENWFFNENQEVLFKESILEVDEDIGYLLGLIAGDGHLAKNGTTLGISTQIEALKKAELIIKNKFNIIKQNYVVKRNGAENWRWGSRKLNTFLTRVFGLEVPGAKSDRIVIPNIIKTSSIFTIGAFIAGLLDSDGYVYKEKCQLKLSSVSEQIIKEVGIISSLFGANITYRENSPRGKGKRALYELMLSGKANMNFVFDYVFPNMVVKHKVERLRSFKEIAQKSFARSRIPLSKNNFSDIESFTFDFRSSQFEDKNKKPFVSLIEDNEYDGILSKVFDKIEAIESVDVVREETDFYDLSMDNDCNNYLAGKQSLTFIHNTGSSSVETIIPLLADLGTPVGVIYVLPKATEDAQSKSNAIETLAKLARLTADDMVSCLVVADNARIEQIYGGLSQSQFWDAANEAIVEPIHIFNSLTAQASRFTSLDPSDFGKVISCGDCSVYGMIEVDEYEEETALAEAVIESLNQNMLAEGFDLKQARVGGVIIAGSQEALNRLPAINIDYAFYMISEQTDGASIFRGVYAQDDIPEGIRIYTWFAGLGLPQDRIENLKKESKAQAAIAAKKESKRTASMTLDLEENKISSVQSQIHRKIKSKKSGFGKLQRGRGSIIDKRRRR